MKENTYIVYVDVFFLVNFFMDYLILHLTSKVMHKKHEKIRLVAGAVFGACYSVAMLLPLLSHLRIVTLLSLVAGFIMVFIAFGYGNFTEYAKSTVFLMCIAFLMGGLMNYLYYSTEFGVVLGNILNGDSTKAVNTRKFIFVTGLAYISIVLLVAFFRAQKKNMDIIFDVKLSFRGRSVVAKGLLDTGNTLVEPISGKIVHIAEYALMKPIIEGDETAKENICVIPYNSVGEENGLLYGFRIDEMVVLINDEPKFIYSPIIAVYDGKISERNKFSVILNRDTMEDF